MAPVSVPGPVAGRPTGPAALPAFMRGSSSREHLSIKWNFPVHKPEQERRGDESISEEIRQALDLKQAFAAIAGEDPRPLLILRECLTCTGTDDALLTRQADNERTMLMTRWFNCVKLPADVLEDNHPFHALFTGEKPAHLFASTSDGSARIELSGEQSRTELWKAMGATLEAGYASAYEKHLKQLSQMLSRFDELDLQIATANAKLEETIERYGDSSKKMAKAEAELSKLRIAKGDLNKEMEKHSQLKLRKPSPSSGT